MSKILDLSPRKKTVLDASSLTPMEPISTPLERDLVLAAISIVPAATLWITYDYFYTAIALAFGIFIIMEYTIPAYLAGKISLAPVTNALTQAREMIRTRVARGA